MDLETKMNLPLGRTMDKNDPHYDECKVQYTRDFLLSLRNLDACKNFPNDFDRSILSELNDSCYYHVQQDRKKPSSNLSSQGFRNNEYCIPPSSRGDSHNHSRVVYGRWDSRSVARSDKDSDSQSDRDSDPGWLHGIKSNGTLKNLEHDGLLGNGSYQKQQMYSGRSTFQKVRANEAYNIKRNSDSYLPPRTYKALPHPRREGNDFYNDETFGSFDRKSEDNVQEEQRRRASFELMREEQKALIENSKSVQLKDDGHFVPSVCLEDTMVQSQETKPLLFPCSNGVAEQKNLEVKFALENFLNEGLVDPKHNNAEARVRAPSRDSSVVDIGKQLPQILDLTFNKFETGDKYSVDNELVEVGNQIKGMINCSSLTNDAINGEEICLGTHCKKSDDNMVDMEKMTVSPRQQQSTSILEKLFCTSTVVNDEFSSGFGKQHNHDEVANNNGLDTVQTSKFSQLFTEGIKPEDGSSSSQSCDLLSLIIGGEKGMHRASDINNFDGVSSQTYDSGNHEIEIHMNSCRGNKIPPILTCEDLELSLFSNVDDSQPSEISSGYGRGDHPNITNVNDTASQHLLSLIIGGGSPNTEKKAFKVEQNGDQSNGKDDVGKVCTSDNNSLTLETLFGSAFMKELQDSVGSARIDISEPVGESASATGSVTVTDIGSGAGMANRDDLYPCFDSHQNAFSTKHNKCFDKVSENHLSEGESFISTNNHSGPLVSAKDNSVRSSTHTEKQFYSNSSDIVGNLASFNTVFNHKPSMIEGQDSIHAGPSCTLKTNVFPENLSSASSSFDFQNQMSHGRLLSGYSFCGLNNNSHMKLTPGNSTIPRRFPPNALNHYFERPDESSLDQSCQKAMLHMQMQMQMEQMHISGHPHPHLLRGISNNPHLMRGISSSPNLPLQLTRNAALGFGHDTNVMHGFHAGVRQSNFGTLGNVSGVDFRGGSGDPEAVKRMVEMQVGQQAMYGFQVDTGFRYR